MSCAWPVNCGKSTRRVLNGTGSAFDEDRPSKLTGTEAGRARGSEGRTCRTRGSLGRDAMSEMAELVMVGGRGEGGPRRQSAAGSVGRQASTCTLSRGIYTTGHLVYSYTHIERSEQGVILKLRSRETGVSAPQYVITGLMLGSYAARPRPLANTTSDIVFPSSRQQALGERLDKVLKKGGDAHSVRSPFDLACQAQATHLLKPADGSLELLCLLPAIQWAVLVLATAS